MSNATSRIKCRRDYMTAPVPGSGVKPERIRVLRRDAVLPGYFIVRIYDRSLRHDTVALHESHIGAAVYS